MIIGRSAIVTEAIQPDAWEKIKLKEAEMNKVPKMFIDTEPQQAPVFTTHLTSKDNLVEGQHVQVEAQVEPRADPNLRTEWYKNGLPLTTGILLLFSSLRRVGRSNAGISTKTRAPR